MKHLGVMNEGNNLQKVEKHEWVFVTDSKACDEP